MIVRRGSAAEMYQRRRAWVAAQDLAGVPGFNDDVSDEGRARLEAMRVLMVAAGVIGKTAAAQQRETIRRVVSEVRGEKLAHVSW